jgi:nucleoid-associated protein EbfC
MGSGFAKKKKEAKRLQEQFQQMQEQVKSQEVTGSAGNGLVELTLTGDNEMKRLKINPECVDPEDVEGLEDLICAAYKDACKKLEAATPKMSLPGIPGLSF